MLAVNQQFNPVNRLVRFLLLGWLLAVLLLPSLARAADDENDAITRTGALVEDLQTTAFPELKDARIEVKVFHSDSDYFQARFSFERYLTLRRMRYVIYVNPAVYELNCPPDAVRAILAHELAHVAFYRRRNRLRLVGLSNLTRKSYTVRFERGADLNALARGFGVGLKLYREWLYAHIPARSLKAKQRDYFTPAEIDALLPGLSQPALLDCWRKHIPRSLMEIESGRCAK